MSDPQIAPKESGAQYAGPNRVFSGVQPTNGLHLGNYLGALKNFVALQDSYECLYCVVDLHAITAKIEPEHLARNTREAAAAFIASGVDPKRSAVFAQSAVSQHTELAWIFNCIARMGWMNRMTQFKEKAGKDRENASVGLFTYPALMAADILAYKATHVPVGEDQKQHLELARDIAQKFNNDLNAPGFFPLPEPLIQGPGARVMSLRDGTKKMSKSDPSDQSRINLTDDADAIAQKLKRATTDAFPMPETVEGLETRPEVDNLVGLFAALSDSTKAQVVADFAGKGFAQFKPALADLAAAKLAPIADEMRRLLADQTVLDGYLRDGADRAAAIAAPVLDDVKRHMGFWR
jgi:tryptophanyl-tRNA synthetase